MVSADSRLMHANRLALLSTIPLPPQNSKNTGHESYQPYHIKDLKCSENAWLIFNTHKVIKILRPYDDCRYSLKERQNRHKCLLEGLKWNRKFTRSLHLGLARYCSLAPSRLTITLGEVLANPKLNDLDPDAEYALVMNKLPVENRLDVLLKNSDINSREHYRSKLVRFLVSLHTSPAFLPSEIGRNKSWGSILQLKEKLISNLVSVENPDTPNKEVLNTHFYRSLLYTCKMLRGTIIPILTNAKYRQFQQYFVERVQKRQIKRCHGDLKSRNIWIMSNLSGPKSAIYNGVLALDAVDFNPVFCNIDTLSDFAMLVADIHTRTHSSEFANAMMMDYLCLTNQDERASRFVLTYYLIEKAFVGALVSILYDDQVVLGLRYLETTWTYLRELKMLIND